MFIGGAGRIPKSHRDLFSQLAFPRQKAYRGLAGAPRLEARAADRRDGRREEGLSPSGFPSASLSNRNGLGTIL